MSAAAPRPGIRPIILGCLLIILAHVWLIGIALYAGAHIPNIATRTVEVPYYILLVSGIGLSLFQMKLWIYRRLMNALRGGDR